jgi:para-nitrobenzyl esterase
MNPGSACVGVPGARAALSAFRAVSTLLAAVLALVTASASAAPVVETDSGRVAGTQTREIAAFRGLPYAAPPVGAMRWRAPQPTAAWSGSRDASKVGNACPQKRGLSLEGGGDPGTLDEDCLNLNVFTPRAEPGARLPVMVWLHGGALIFGTGGLPLYDGVALARQGVVVVTLNYRLGPLGFFVHPAIEREAPGGAVNFGLLDQIAALRWVQRNIAAFGGDPGQVTLFGQSAGAQSVLALMSSPLSRGLMQRAIVQSAYGLPARPRAKARETGVRVASAVGLSGADVSAEQLRAVPAERLAALEGNELSLAPGFIVGDPVVPVAPLEAFRAGTQAKIPLLIGSNSDETSVALAFGIEPAQLIKKLGAGGVLVRPLYGGVAGDAELGRQVVRDAVFTAFARRVAVLHSANAPVWRYYFSRVPDAVRGKQPGVPHGGEVAPVFGTADLCGCTGATPTDKDRAADLAVAARWVSFARDGQPDVPGLPRWPADAKFKNVLLEFGDDQAVRPAFMRHRLNAFIAAGNLLER